jgi:hypothetical protein
MLVMFLLSRDYPIERRITMIMKFDDEPSYSLFEDLEKLELLEADIIEETEEYDDDCDNFDIDLDDDFN